MLDKFSKIAKMKLLASIIFANLVIGVMSAPAKKTGEDANVSKPRPIHRHLTEPPRTMSLKPTKQEIEALRPRVEALRTTQVADLHR